MSLKIGSSDASWIDKKLIDALVGEEEEDGVGVEGAGESFDFARFGDLELGLRTVACLDIVGG